MRPRPASTLTLGNTGYRGPWHVAHALVWAPGGRRLLVAGRQVDEDVVIGPGAAFGPDGGTNATGPPLELWDACTGAPIRKGGGEDAGTLAWSLDDIPSAMLPDGPSDEADLPHVYRAQGGAPVFRATRKRASEAIRPRGKARTGWYPPAESQSVEAMANRMRPSRRVAATGSPPWSGARAKSGRRGAS